MSQTEPPIIQQLRKQQEQDARRMGQQLTLKDQQNSASTKNGQSSQEQLQSQVQVRLQVKQAKQAVKPLNLFANKSQKENKSNIFANHKSVNLFNLGHQSNQKAADIFATASTKGPCIESNEEDASQESNVDNEQKLNKEQQLPETSIKEMKYQYEIKTQKLAQFKLVRFRSGIGAVKEGVLLSIEKDIDNAQPNVLYFFLRSEATKVILYNAFIPKNTKTQNFMGKAENIKLNVIKAKKDQQKVVAEKEVVKIQFESEDQSKRFASVLQILSTDTSK